MPGRDLAEPRQRVEEPGVLVLAHLVPDGPVEPPDVELQVVKQRELPMEFGPRVVVEVEPREHAPAGRAELVGRLVERDAELEQLSVDVVLQGGAHAHEQRPHAEHRPHPPHARRREVGLGEHLPQPECARRDRVLAVGLRQPLSVILQPHGVAEVRLEAALRREVRDPGPVAGTPGLPGTSPP